MDIIYKPKVKTFWIIFDSELEVKSYGFVDVDQVLSSSVSPYDLETFTIFEEWENRLIEFGITLEVGTYY